MLSRTTITIILLFGIIILASQYDSGFMSGLAILNSGPGFLSVNPIVAENQPLVINFNVPEGIPASGTYPQSEIVITAESLVLVEIPRSNKIDGSIIIDTV